MTCIFVIEGTDGEADADAAGLEDVNEKTTAAEMDLIARELVAEPVRIEVVVIDPRRLPELEDEGAECGISKVEIGNVDDTVIAFMDSFEGPRWKTRH